MLTHQTKLSLVKNDKSNQKFFEENITFSEQYFSSNIQEPKSYLDKCMDRLTVCTKLKCVLNFWIIIYYLMK